MAETLAVALLAAGSSKRFGTADKLTAELRGERLGLHAARAVPTSLFARCWVIAYSAKHPCSNGWREAGFELCVNPKASEGMGTSVAQAASLAIKAKADALMIALADMPMVPEAHFRALAHRADRGGICVSQSRSRRMPPAIFGAAHFERLAQLGGDKGARDILGEGDVLPCPPEWLRDIDTPDDL